MTLDQLIAIMPRAQFRAYSFWPELGEHMREFGIEGKLREAAFLATIAVESGELQYTKELWGPTPQQERYEGRADLGNTEPGDGSRFRGRGLIQLTGRANYQKASEALGIDYVTEPTLMQVAAEASRVSCWWWSAHGCNELADSGDFKAVTRRVNGGLTAYEKRLAYYEKALQILATEQG